MYCRFFYHKSSILLFVRGLSPTPWTFSMPVDLQCLDRGAGRLALHVISLIIWRNRSRVWRHTGLPGHLGGSGESQVWHREHTPRQGFRWTRTQGWRNCDWQVDRLRAPPALRHVSHVNSDLSACVWRKWLCLCVFMCVWRRWLWMCVCVMIVRVSVFVCIINLTFLKTSLLAQRRQAFN